MLNGQSVLTHQETFTERKPFTDTKEKEVKKKLTLFEIAQKNKKYLTNIKQLEIREKQNKSSNSLNLKVFLNSIFLFFLCFNYYEVYVLFSLKYTFKLFYL